MTATPLSRRAALTGSLAVALGGSLLALPAFGAPDHPDAALARLWTRLEALMAKYEVSDRKCDELHIRAKEMTPPLPEVLRYTVRDRTFGIPAPGNRRFPGFFTSFDLGELERCDCSEAHYVSFSRACEAGLPAASHIGIYHFAKKAFVVRKPRKEAEARLAQLVEAIKDWREAQYATLETSGYSAASDARDRINDEITEVYQTIVATPALTLPGLAVKARAIKKFFSEEPVSFGETDDVLLAGSIVNDLLTMAGETPATV
jgi:hypothetical protein